MGVLPSCWHQTGVRSVLARPSPRSPCWAAAPPQTQGSPSPGRYQAGRGHSLVCHLALSQAQRGGRGWGCRGWGAASGKAANTDNRTTGCFGKLPAPCRRWLATSGATGALPGSPSK